MCSVCELTEALMPATMNMINEFMMRSRSVGEMSAICAEMMDERRSMIAMAVSEGVATLIVPDG